MVIPSRVDNRSYIPCTDRGALVLHLSTNLLDPASEYTGTPPTSPLPLVWYYPDDHHHALYHIQGKCNRKG
jgi:hypothetical protein